MSLLEVYQRLIAEIRSAWRFRWQGAAVAWLVCLGGFAYVFWIPDVYQASARVYVDTSSVLRPLLENRIVPPDLATQLSYVRQALLGREHLERVVRENSLDVSITNEVQYEALLTRLRSEIDIDGLALTNASYTIRYRHINREKAIGVVATLLNSLVETTLGETRQGTDTAAQFLDARILEYENELQQAEQALADFKRRNADRLPGAEGGYFERRSAQTEGLEKVEKDLRLAESRRERILTQLNSESPVMLGTAELQPPPPPNSIDARIRDLTNELDALLVRYTDKHPDVINTREALRHLEAQRAAQLSSVGVRNTDQEISALDANPVHQQLRISLNQVEVEIDALRADIADRKQKLAELQALIDEVPEVEAELKRLNRDYDIIYEQYQGMVRSRETQELSRKASDSDEVSFKIIDPPFAAFEPVAPNRLLMLTAVFVASLGAGGAWCWFLAQLRPVFVSVSMLRDVVGYPVLGAVSLTRGSQQLMRTRLAAAGYGVVIATLFFVFVAAVVVGMSHWQ